MSAPASKDDINEVKASLNASISEVKASIIEVDKNSRENIDEVIGILKDFIGQVSGEFIVVNKRLDKLDSKYDHLINTIDGFIGRIDKYETELAARDSQFDKLLVWARKVSEKTGIPLENL